MKSFWPYLAGILDGEGCIAIYKTPGCKDKRYRKGRRGSSFTRMVQISNTYLPLLEEIRERTQLGRVACWSRRANQKPNYEWRVGAKEDIVAILYSVYPYLREKKKQAFVMIQACLGQIDTLEASKTLKQLK